MGRFAAPLALALLLGLAACSTSESRQEVDREEIAAALEVYLPLLGEAYASGNLEALEDHAAIKEISRIRRRIEELGLQGRTLVLFTVHGGADQVRNDQ